MDTWGFEHLESMAPDPRAPAHRRAVLRPARPDSRPTMLTSRHPHPAARHRARGRRSLLGRAPPTHARARRRNVPRGCPDAGDPMRTRAMPTSGSPPLPTRHRQHRNHRQRPLTTRADDPRHQQPQTHPLTRSNHAKGPCHSNADRRGTAVAIVRSDRHPRPPPWRISSRMSDRAIARGKT